MVLSLSENELEPSLVVAIMLSTTKAQSDYVELGNFLKVKTGAKPALGFIKVPLVNMRISCICQKCQKIKYLIASV